MAIDTLPATTPPRASGQLQRTDAPARRGRRRLTLTAWLLLVPSIVVLAAAMGYPLVWQIITSMQSFGLAQQFGKPAPFVGLENYAKLVTDPYMWTVVGRSVLFCLLTAAITMVVGVLMALLMKAVGRVVRVILQVSMLLAWAMPIVAAMTVWTWLFDWRRGVVNWLLTRMGLDFEGHNWLANPLSFFAVALIIVVWMSVPFVAFSIFAGLTQVPDEVLEAAQMDGASGWQRLRGIILPMVRPVIAIVMLLQIIWDLRVFTQIKMLQDRGSIASETNLLGTYIYQLGTGSSDFAMASAVSVFVLIITIALSWFYVRQMLKEGA
ncbi:sugar ABC transporter permease [Microbacterium sp. STN6]|uniref:carbohydrate ABC transporter permease n=1 Tax=Microbacterium sp. STN6 TaxID=2995588 RepID=UPI0022610138|nr:sugar ABC transporter permease [Microbacterium sp. STN6]MCX7523334.1 sugar ABC transporter permease [Microbacterium sp. STN6]